MAFVSVLNNIRDAPLFMLKQDTPMFTRALLSIFILFTSGVSAQVYSPLWAREGGGSANDKIWQTATDAQGNVFAVGEFSGFAQFGSVSLASAGGTDIFIVKYNSAGTLQWAVKAGSVSSDNATGITTDPAGNCYITGSYTTTASFGNGVFCNSNTIFPYSFLFVACYNNAGVCQWAKGGQFACTIDAGVTSSGIDIHYDHISGDLVFTGLVNGVVTGNIADPFASCVSFDSIPFYGWGSGFLDGGLFWGRITTSGNCLFLKEEQNNFMSSEGTHITTDINGDVILAIRYGVQFTYDSITFSTLPSFDLRTVILKSDINGNTLWVQEVAGTGTVAAEEVETDSAGNIFLCGWFTDTLLDDPQTPVSSANINTDGFVEKFLPDGTPVWIRTISGPGNDFATGITYLDSLDQMALCGLYFAQATVGGVPIANTSGNENLFIALFTQTGAVSQLNQPNNSLGYSRCDAVSADVNSNIYVGGNFTGQISWGNDTLLNTSSENALLIQLANNKATSVEESVSTSGLSVFPNPFSDQFTVVSNRRAEEIIVFDALGKLVYTIQNPGLLHTVNLNNLSPGFFMLRVRYENGETAAIRLIKQL